MVFIFIIEFLEEMKGGKMGSWEGKKLKAGKLGCWEGKSER
jgi:hypothetical protein